MSSRLTITPVCPRCGYDQSGEVATWTDRCPLDGRCPECGAAFRWSAALRPEPLHPVWSFEHATTFRRIAIGWLATPVRCIQPGRYWKRMWNAEPVRVGRIVVFLIVWWAMVRTVWSVLMAAGILADLIGPISGANWRHHAHAETLNAFVRFIGLSWAGTLPLIGMVGWDTEDRAEYYFIAGLAPAISLVWLLLVAAGPNRTKAPGISGAQLVRALLMSLLIVPIVYESLRLLGTWQSFWFTGPPDVFLLASFILTVVWVLAWWSAAIRHASVGVSGRSIALFHFASVLFGGVFQIGLFMGLEGMF